MATSESLPSVLAIGASPDALVAVDKRLTAAGYAARGFLIGDLDAAKEELLNKEYALVLLGGMLPHSHPAALIDLNAFLLAHCPATKVHQITGGDFPTGTPMPPIPEASAVVAVTLAQRLLNGR